MWTSTSRTHCAITRGRDEVRRPHPQPSPVSIATLNQTTLFPFRTMKTQAFSSIRCAVVWMISVAAAMTSAFAATFTSDTVIGVLNTNYDSADIIVSNCVVTIDGPHSFGSLRIRNGGVVTHTQVTNGI